MRILFVTGNQNKVAEANGILSPLGFVVEQLLIGGEVPDLIEPQSEEIEEIAKFKLEQAVSLAMGTEFENEALLVEDSGLFIDSLSGFRPFSSFVHETIGLSGILSLMSGETDRSAEFRAVAAVSLQGNMLPPQGYAEVLFQKIYQVSLASVTTQFSSRKKRMVGHVPNSFS